MVYGQKPKYYSYIKKRKSLFMQPNTLTYPIDHMVFESRVEVQRSFPVRGFRNTENSVIK